MLSTTLLTIITPFLLATTAVSSPIPVPPTAILATRDTAEMYILANCYNNVTKASYASAYWYYPDFLPDYPEPQAIGNISTKHAVVFEGLKIDITTPFTLVTTIPKNATEAKNGAIVADASTSSFAGPSATVKGTGLVFYTPETNVNCFEEYYVRDNQSSDDN